MTPAAAAPPGPPDHGALLAMLLLARDDDRSAVSAAGSYEILARAIRVMKSSSCSARPQRARPAINGCRSLTGTTGFAAVRVAEKPATFTSTSPARRNGSRVSGRGPR